MRVVVLTSADWPPQVRGPDLAVTWAQCGNDVSEDGETLHLGTRIRTDRESLDSLV
jgi:hypothetical protein